MTTRTKRKQDEIEEDLQALPSDGSDEEGEEDYEEDFENSEDNEDDVEEEEEEEEEEGEENATAAAEPAPVPVAEEPINAGIASRPSKKRKLAPPKLLQADVQELSDDDAGVAAGAAGAAAGADGAEEDEEEDVEEEEEQFYESENGEEEAVDLLTAGKRDVAKSNVKASIKSAELVDNDDDDEDE